MLSTEKQTDRQTDRQTDKLTTSTKNITSFAKEVITKKRRKLMNISKKMKTKCHNRAVLSCSCVGSQSAQIVLTVSYR